MARLLLLFFLLLLPPLYQIWTTVAPPSLHRLRRTAASPDLHSTTRKAARDMSEQQRSWFRFERPQLAGYMNLRGESKLDELSGLIESFLSHTDFSLSFAKHVFSEKHTNFVLSPLSIHVALSLLAAGSNNPTRDQLLAFLRSNSIEQVHSLSSKVINLVFADGAPLGGPRLSLANGIWLNRKLKPAFRDIVHNVYKAACNQVDFRNKDEVIEQVNGWVDKETNGLIKSILGPDSVDDLTRLILANAVYFEGTWQDKFDVSNTKDRKFFLSNRKSIKVPFMTSYKDQYVDAYNGFKVLQLPYAQGNDERRFSMCIFLPDAKDGLPALLEKMVSEPGFIGKHIPYEKVGVGDFGIPRFEINSGFEASDVVKGQGVVLPFSKDGGGLTEMVEPLTDGDEDLYVSRMIHKAFIKVNEEGTEAAAVTLMMLSGSAMRMEKKRIDFVADHPFLFVIREDVSGLVLFIGQLLHPLAG